MFVNRRTIRIEWGDCDPADKSRQTPEEIVSRFLNTEERAAQSALASA